MTITAGGEMDETRSSAALSTGDPVVPRWARFITVFAVFCYGLIMVMNVLGEYVDAGATAVCIACVIALVVMQVIHSSRRAPYWPLRYKVALLSLQAAITALPTIAYDLVWGSMWGFVGGSILLMLPRTLARCLYVLVIANTLVLSLLSGANGLYVVYLVESSVLASLVIYGFSKLAVLINALHDSRAQLARMAVTQERMRFARDLHDLLGYSLSAIALKGELVQRLISHNPTKAREETVSLLQVARQALADVRLVSRGYRDMSLHEEVESAVTVLAAADVRAEVDVTCGRLHPVVDTVLATALREGITNILRHSTVQECTITVSVEEDGEEGQTVRLALMNDRPHAQPEDITSRNGGSGLDNLRTRFTAIGGELTAGTREDGCFHLVGWAPTQPRNIDAGTPESDATFNQRAATAA